MVTWTMQKQEQKCDNNDANANDILFLLHAKCNNEIMLDQNMNFNCELIADNGKHARTKNGLNEDLSHVNNVFLTVASRLLE